MVCELKLVIIFMFFYMSINVWKYFFIEFFCSFVNFLMYYDFCVCFLYDELRGRKLYD